MFGGVLRRNWHLILVSAAVFLLGGVVGAALGWNSLQVGRTFGALEAEALTDAPDRSPTFFFVHNLKVAAFMWAGALTLAASTVLNAFFNGVVTGTTVYFSLERLTGPELAVLLVPHGVFEYPAIWIAGAAGLKVPSELLDYVRARKEYVLDRSELAEMVVLASFSVGLLAIAAVVEATVTPRLAETMFG